MDWKRITTELDNELGTARLAKLAMTTPKIIESVRDGRREPSYSLGDRLIRMHDSMREIRGRQ